MLRLNADRSEASIRSSSNTSLPSCKSSRHRRCSSTGGPVCLIRSSGGGGSSTTSTGGLEGSPNLVVTPTSCPPSPLGRHHTPLHHRHHHHASLVADHHSPSPSPPRSPTRPHPRHMRQLVDVESLQFNLRDVQRQVCERDERVSLLLQQLSSLEADCARDIGRSSRKQQRSERQVKRLKRLCDQYERCLNSRKSHSLCGPEEVESKTDKDNGLQKETERWKQQFEEVRARMFSMEHETEQLRRALQLANSSSSQIALTAVTTANSSTKQPRRLSAGGGSAPCVHRLLQQELEQEREQKLKQQQLQEQDENDEIEEYVNSKSCTISICRDESNITISDETVNEESTKSLSITSKNSGKARNDDGDVIVVDDVDGGQDKMATKPPAPTETETTSDVVTTEAGDVSKSVAKEEWCETVHSVKDLDQLKSQLLSAKCEASETQTQLKYKIRELEEDVKRYKTIATPTSSCHNLTLGGAAAAATAAAGGGSCAADDDDLQLVDCPKELCLWDPQELLQQSADLEQVVDPQLRGDVAIANDALRRRVRQLEQMIEQFKSQQSELGTHIQQMDQLSQEVELLKQATARASHASGQASARLRDALLQERAVSRERLDALRARDGEVASCHRELRELTRHVSGLSVDITELTGRVKTQSCDSTDEFQRALRNSASAIEQKEEEIRNLREKLEEANTTNAKTRAENARLQQELDSRTERAAILEQEVSEARAELERGRGERRREQEEREAERREAAALEYARDRLSDELEAAKTRNAELNEDSGKLRTMLRSTEQALSEASYELQEARRRQQDAARDLHALRCELRAAETDAGVKSAEVEELLGQRERLEAVCSKQRERIQELLRDLAASYDEQRAVAAQQPVVQQYRAAEISQLLDKLAQENSELRRMLDALAREMADNILPRLSCASQDVEAATADGAAAGIEEQQQPHVSATSAAAAAPAAPAAATGSRTFDLRSKIEQFIMSTNSSEDTITSLTRDNRANNDDSYIGSPTRGAAAAPGAASAAFSGAGAGSGGGGGCPFPKIEDDIGRSVEQIRMALEEQSDALLQARAWSPATGGGAGVSPPPPPPLPPAAPVPPAAPPHRQPHSWDGVLANKLPGTAAVSSDLGTRQADVPSGRLDGRPLQEEFQKIVMRQEGLCFGYGLYSRGLADNSLGISVVSSISNCSSNYIVCRSNSLYNSGNQITPRSRNKITYKTDDVTRFRDEPEAKPETDKVVDRGVDVLNRYLDLRSRIMTQFDRRHLVTSPDPPLSPPYIVTSPLPTPVTSRLSPHMATSPPVTSPLSPEMTSPSSPPHMLTSPQMMTSPQITSPLSPCIMTSPESPVSLQITSPQNTSPLSPRMVTSPPMTLTGDDRDVSDCESGICVIYTNNKRIFRSEDDCKLEQQQQVTTFACSRSTLSSGSSCSRNRTRHDQLLQLQQRLEEQETESRPDVIVVPQQQLEQSVLLQQEQEQQRRFDDRSNDFHATGDYEDMLLQPLTSQDEDSDVAGGGATRELDPETRPFPAQQQQPPQQPEQETACSSSDAAEAAAAAAATAESIAAAARPSRFRRALQVESRAVTRRPPAVDIPHNRRGVCPCLGERLGPPCSPCVSCSGSNAEQTGKVRRLRRQMVRMQRQLDTERRYNELLLREYDRETRLLRQIRKAGGARPKAVSRFQAEQQALALQSQHNRVAALANTVTSLQNRLDRHTANSGHCHRKRTPSPKVSRKRSAEDNSDMLSAKSTFSPTRQSKRAKGNQDPRNQLNYALYEVKFANPAPSNSARLAKAKLVKYKNVAGKMILKRNVQMAQNRHARQEMSLFEDMSAEDTPSDVTCSGCGSHRDGKYYAEQFKPHTQYVDNPLPSLMTSVAMTAMSTSLVLKLKPKDIENSRKLFE